MSYAFDDEDVQTWTPDQPFPTRIAIYTGQIRAHNAAFERLIFWYVLCPDFGVPEPALERFYCTAAQARANCAPGSLEDVGRFAGAFMKKDRRGAQLIRLLSIPQSDGGFREDAGLMQEMIDYCEQDVRAMRAFSQAMRDLSAEELADYHVSERINDRGILLDKPLAEAAVRYAAEELVEIEEEVAEVTEGAITSVRSPRMREWVLDRVGPQALKLMEVWKDGDKKYSIDKTVRANLLSFAEENPDEVPEEVKTVVQCADDLWASSVAKFSRAAALADAEDSRVRGAFVFAGGSATGRASSYGLQLHNLSRKAAKQPQLIRDAMVRGHKIVPTYGNRVTDVLKSMLRPMLVPAKGRVFIVYDWSSIEARVLPWLSGNGDATLQVFRDGRDIYIAVAARMFNVAEEQVTDAQRQLGKVAVLACLAEGTLVLTHNGWKAIEEVLATDLLWDGIEWIAHQGIVPRGVKPTVNVAGINATPDHLFLAANKWVEAAQLASNGASLSQALEIGSANLPSWAMNMVSPEVSHTQKPGAVAAHPHIGYQSITCVKAHLHGAIVALKKRLAIGLKTSISMLTHVQMTRTGEGYSTGYPLVKTDATIQTTEAIQTTAVAASICTGLGTPTKRRSLRTSCRWTDGINRVWNLTASMLMEVTNRVIYGSFPSATTATTNAAFSKCSSTSSSLRRVYDIAHAGPRNRFTVMSAKGPLITHNCGFAGGVGAFAAMGRIYGVMLPESEARRMVDLWRRANPWAVPFWSDLEIAYTRAIRNPGTEMVAGRVTYLYDGQHLWYALPSGRVLCYPFARIEEDGVTYAKAAWKPAADAKEWPRARLWKGLGAENLTQATANCLLRHALRRLDAAGFDVVAHVHDEVVIECDADQAELASVEIKKCLTTPPEWAHDLPLAASGAIMARYGK